MNADGIPLSYKNSRSQMFFKIGVLENLAIFIEKQLYWIEALNFIKKRLHHRYFLWILWNVLEQLLLQSTSGGYFSS